jgi:two-component system, NtrC family, response regulator HydG
MKAEDLDLRELFEFQPEGGVLKFGGQRAIILDAVALGLLRKSIIEMFGVTAARGLLTSFGYAHGWRTAEAMKGAFPWDSESDWRRAGGRLHRLQGMVIPETPQKSDVQPPPFAEGLWHDSYEAEQHLLHLGRAESPVCWTLCGFASGYLSYSNGREIYCVEDRCRGKGDAVCHMIGRPKEEWDDEVVKAFGKQCLDASLEKVREALKAAEQKLARRKSDLVRAGVPPALSPSGLVAQSDEMVRLFELARRVARVDSTVLVTGESGVGKEGLAHLIHDESARAGGPFVPLNCAAVPETLLESELFGHAKGAFTGAAADRAGLFESAQGGTLFLDEIGEVPLSMQAKLLRVLQEREVRRVGENKSRKVDVRVLAATNRNLAREVQAGRFREDLYYRLRVIELRVPALRDRRDDVLPLARLFVARASERLGRRISGLTPRAAQQLLRYDWPGNVRELENAIERAVVLADGARLDVDDLPEEVGLALPDPSAPGRVRPLEDMERDYILAVLKAAGDNKTRAAEQLRIGTATLFRKLKQYGKNGRQQR